MRKEKIDKTTMDERIKECRLKTGFTQEELQEGTLLHRAFLATCKKRATIFTKEEAIQICERILHDKAMKDRWESFRLDNYFVGEIEWTVVMKQVSKVMEWFPEQ